MIFLPLALDACYLLVKLLETRHFPLLLAERCIGRRAEPQRTAGGDQTAGRLDTHHARPAGGAENSKLPVIRGPGIDPRKVDLRKLRHLHLASTIFQQKDHGFPSPAEAKKTQPPTIAIIDSARLQPTTRPALEHHAPNAPRQDPHEGVRSQVRLAQRGRGPDQQMRRDVQAVGVTARTHPCDAPDKAVAADELDVNAALARTPRGKTAIAKPPQRTLRVRQCGVIEPRRPRMLTPAEHLVAIDSRGVDKHRLVSRRTLPMRNQHRQQHRSQDRHVFRNAQTGHFVLQCTTFTQRAERLLARELRRPRPRRADHYRAFAPMRFSSALAAVYSMKSVTSVSTRFSRRPSGVLIL